MAALEKTNDPGIYKRETAPRRHAVCRHLLGRRQAAAGNPPNAPRSQGAETLTRGRPGPRRAVRGKSPILPRVRG
jgi:hypothetical protein